MIPDTPATILPEDPPEDLAAIDAEIRQMKVRLAKMQALRDRLVTDPTLLEIIRDLYTSGVIWQLVEPAGGLAQGLVATEAQAEKERVERLSDVLEESRTEEASDETPSEDTQRPVGEEGLSRRPGTAGNRGVRH